MGRVKVIRRPLSLSGRGGVGCARLYCMPRKSKSPVPFQQVLADLISWLEKKSVQGQVIGGVAASFLGRPRLTQDVDVLVLLDEDDWDDFLEEGKRYGFIPRRADAIAFAKANRVLLVRHSTSGIDMDISLGSLPFEKESVRRSLRLKIGKLIIPIPTPEDLIIMKAIAHRAKDMIDIESIIEMNARIDLKRVRKWVKAFADVLDMPEIYADLERLIQKKE